MCARRVPDTLSCSSQPGFPMLGVWVALLKTCLRIWKRVLQTICPNIICGPYHFSFCYCWTFYVYVSNSSTLCCTLASPIKEQDGFRTFWFSRVFAQKVQFHWEATLIMFLWWWGRTTWPRFWSGLYGLQLFYELCLVFFSLNSTWSRLDPRSFC
jgi:hypothetical protein